MPCGIGLRYLLNLQYNDQSIGINAHRNTIVYSLGSKFINYLTPLFLVKPAVSFPNLFGEEIFDLNKDSSAETTKEEC